MAITPLDTNLNIIAALDDEPNDLGGLTAAQLKAKFDEGGNAIKSYINDTMISDIETDIAAAVQGVALGEIPDGTITGAKLSAALQTEIDGKADIADIYSKANTLTDTTKTLYGLGSEAVPDEVLGKLAGSLVEIGDIKTTICTELGSKWLLCNGAVVSQASYPDLYSWVSRSIPPLRGKAGNNTVSGYSQIHMGGNTIAAITNYNPYVTTDAGATWSTINIYPSFSSSYQYVTSLAYFNGYYIGNFNNNDYSACGVCYSPTLVSTAYTQCTFVNVNTRGMGTLTKAGSYLFAVNNHGGDHINYTTNVINWDYQSYGSNYGLSYMWYLNGTYINKIGTSSPTYYYGAALASSGNSLSLPIIPQNFLYFDGKYVAYNTTQMAYASSLAGPWTTVALPTLISGTFKVVRGVLMAVVATGGKSIIYKKSLTADWQYTSFVDTYTYNGYGAFFEIGGSSDVYLGLYTSNNKVGVYSVTLNTLPVLSADGAYVYIKALE